MSIDEFTADGGCTCGTTRFRMRASPMFVHCCHCTWCQRETGSAFALNAMIEAMHVELLTGETEAIEIPTSSGRSQTVHRCPECKVALWSEYSQPGLYFIRVGTLDNPDACPPDVHIYTKTKLPWIVVPEGAAVFEEYYNPKEQWPDSSQSRWKAMKNN